MARVISLDELLTRGEIYSYVENAPIYRQHARAEVAFVMVEEREGGRECFVVGC